MNTNNSNDQTNNSGPNNNQSTTDQPNNSGPNNNQSTSNQLTQNRMLIGITGKIGAGKSLSSRILERYHNFTEYTMAGPLKKMATSIGFTEEEVNGTQEQKLVKNKYWDVSGREFLQKFGTEVCRDALPRIINMNFNNRTLWCRIFEIYYEEHKKNMNVVVSDCRFKDELDLIKELGGITVKIIRNDTITDNTISTSHKCHPSELLEYKTNFVINNNGYLQDLTHKIEEMLYMIKIGYHKITNATIYI
jgi:dephospho-CoA kinase